jgi:NADPH:quinone reductase-like Zn-dependent oxidoreductase/acyl carrier protein
MVDLDPASADPEHDARALFEEICADTNEEEVALRGRGRYVHRLTRASFHELAPLRYGNAPGERYSVDAIAPGGLDGAILRRRPRRPPGPGEVEIEVSASGLNFRDLLKAFGMLRGTGADADFLGFECAGRISAVGEGVTALGIGDAVMAFGQACHGSHVTTSESIVAPKPAHLSFEQAATVPIVFLTARYALHDIGRMKPGERVLIHAAAGGVGLAAIQVARLGGAQVLATAGSREKRDYLRMLGVAHVLDSRSLDFAERVMDITGGEGVDIVLNSLAGPAIAVGLSCLRQYGRFLEIGKRDILGHTRVDLHPFDRNLSFSAIDLAPALEHGRDFIVPAMREIVNAFNERVLHPLPHRTFRIGDLAVAMRHMAQAKHIGKIVLSFQDQTVAPQPSRDVAPALFRESATYLISGGLGGFGLGVASWMVDNGARNLVLMGRSAPTDQARQAIGAMEWRNARIVPVQCDVASEREVAGVLESIYGTLPPLRGVIHGAMVLDDDLLVRLDRRRFRSVTAPKILGAWNLHLQTRDAPLDFFVMCSSVSAILGSPGQANYAAANAFLDALAEERHAAGLPALTVNWGPLGDVGYVAEHPQLLEYFSRTGMEALRLDQATAILGHLLRHNAPRAAAFRMDWGKLGRQFQTIRTSPRFAHLFEDTPGGIEHAGGSTRETILAARDGDRRQLLESHLREAVAGVLGTDATRIAVDRPLDELGMDSLMAIELSMRVEADLGLTVPTGTLMSSRSVAHLADAVSALLPADGGTDSRTSAAHEPAL